MLTLYYSPGACSTASHITIEESGLKYEPQQVLLAKGEHKTENYLKINPRGKVPALGTDGGVITENVAIMSYVARQAPDANLIPTDAFAGARCVSMMAWLPNTVHPCFTHFLRPERFTAAESAIPPVKEQGKASFWTNLQEVDSIVSGKQWMQGDQFTACDPYALVFYGWGVRAELPMKDLKAYTAWKERMTQRPAVRKVLEREKSLLLQAA